MRAYTVAVIEVRNACSEALKMQVGNVGMLANMILMSTINRQKCGFWHSKICSQVYVRCQNNHRFIRLRTHHVSSSAFRCALRLPKTPLKADCNYFARKQPLYIEYVLRPWQRGSVDNGRNDIEEMISRIEKLIE